MKNEKPFAVNVSGTIVEPGETYGEEPKEKRTKKDPEETEES